MCSITSFPSLPSLKIIHGKCKLVPRGTNEIRNNHKNDLKALRLSSLDESEVKPLNIIIADSNCEKHERLPRIYTVLSVNDHALSSLNSCY